MILDGKQASSLIKDELKAKISQLEKKPHLAIIQVGHIEASNIYIRNKIKASEYVGMTCSHHSLNENITETELVRYINKLNEDESIDGIIVQLPLPRHLNEETIINMVSPEKDVDGFSFINKGKLFCGVDSFTPATPSGIIKLFEIYNIDLTGKHAVVIGRSNIVGKPMAMMLLQKNATVTICHSKTQNLKAICKEADILVCAIGKARMIDDKYIKLGAIVIDVGINHDENGKLCGDVDFDKVANLASFITPVPGGVGPLTIAMLLSNTYDAYKRRKTC